MQVPTQLIYAPELEPEEEVPEGKTRLYSNLNKKWTIRPSLYHVKMIVKTMLQRRVLLLTHEDHARMAKKLQKRYTDLKLSARIMKSRFEMMKTWAKRLEMLSNVRIHVDPITGLLDATEAEIDELLAYREFSFLKLGRYKSYLDVYELKLVLDELSKEVIPKKERLKLGRRQKYSRSLSVTPKELLASRVDEKELTEAQIQYCEERLRKMGVRIIEPHCLPGNEIVLYKKATSNTEQPKRKTGRLPKVSGLKMLPNQPYNGCLSKKQNLDHQKPFCSICSNRRAVCRCPVQRSWEKETHSHHSTAVVLRQGYGGRTTRSSSVPLMSHDIVNSDLKIYRKARPLQIKNTGDNNYKDQVSRGQHLRAANFSIYTQNFCLPSPGTTQRGEHFSPREYGSNHISDIRDRCRSTSLKYEAVEAKIPVEENPQQPEGNNSYEDQGLEILSSEIEPGTGETPGANQSEYQLVPVRQVLKSQGLAVELPKVSMSNQELAKRKEAVDTLIVMLKQGVLEKTSFLDCCQDVLTPNLLEDYSWLSSIEDDVVLSEILRIISA